MLLLLKIAKNFQIFLRFPFFGNFLRNFKTSLIQSFGKIFTGFHSKIPMELFFGVLTLILALAFGSTTRLKSS